MANDKKRLTLKIFPRNRCVAWERLWPVIYYYDLKTYASKSN